ncbi:uncharacterized protein [Prorops nasuta]|uniref:uncharacterized protein n=1 Tax=Prorops nasuta TaxID=863751 RepID=UPI0034CDECB3
MPLSSNVSSRDALHQLTTTEERRRTGRYIAGGTVLAATLLALHHALLRDASTIAGVCIPAILMASYILWVLYSARRDRRKALRLATALQLTEVISVPAGSEDAILPVSTSQDSLKTSQRDPRDKTSSLNTDFLKNSRLSPDLHISDYPALHLN